MEENSKLFCKVSSFGSPFHTRDAFAKTVLLQFGVQIRAMGFLQCIDVRENSHMTLFPSYPLRMVSPCFTAIFPKPGLVQSSRGWSKHVCRPGGWEGAHFCRPCPHWHHKLYLSSCVAISLCNWGTLSGLHWPTVIEHTTVTTYLLFFPPCSFVLKRGKSLVSFFCKGRYISTKKRARLLILEKLADRVTIAICQLPVTKKSRKILPVVR